MHIFFHREDVCLQTLLLLFKYANKRSFVSTANEVLVGTLMTIGDVNNIFPISFIYNHLHYNTLQYITIHYNTLQHITTHYNTLQYITIHYNTLQYITIHYDKIQYIKIHNTLTGNYLGT